MTKDQEIDFLKSWIDHLPDGAGYLQEIFKDVFGEIERAIRNDFCIIPFRELLETKSELDAKIFASKKEIMELERQKRTLESSVAFITGRKAEAIEKIRMMAKELKRLSDD